jgi:GNAT superfamily N-acetyltransferase
MELSEITLREAISTDVPAIYQLICDLATYEKAAEQVAITPLELEKDGFGPAPAYRCIVAEYNGEVLGFALYYIRYSTWKGRCVYLEDFLVKQEHRRKGIGKLLFDEMIAISKRLNVRLMTWQVLDWNQPAIDFYAKYDSVFDGEWLNGKIYISTLSK